MGSVVESLDLRRTREANYIAYNIILRRVRETVFAVEKQKLLHIYVCVRARASGWLHACACVRACGGMGVLAQACAFARVALPILYATHMRHIVCSLSGSTIFFDIFS